MKKVLVIADMKGKKQVAVHRGVEFARRSGESVHIVAFGYETYIANLRDEKLATKLQKALLKARKQHIQDVVDNMDTEGVKVRLEVVWETDIAGWVDKNVSTDRYSTIVKTGHRTENIVHTPTDWKILRQSNIRVMIVAEKSWRKKNTIMCALDLSSNNKKTKELNRYILTEAKALADLLGGNLMCCYAIAIPSVLVDLDIVDKGTILRKSTLDAAEYYAELAEEFGLERESLHSKAGYAEKVIPSVANKVKATMVVLSTSGRKGVRGKLLGNTAEKVLHQLRTDVLILKYK
ncbi:MAG: universal stress protein [Gammaproteobacteria bacterium]